MFGSLNTDIKDDDTNCLATFSYMSWSKPFKSVLTVPINTYSLYRVT